MCIHIQQQIEKGLYIACFEATNIESDGLIIGIYLQRFFILLQTIVSYNMIDSLRKRLDLASKISSSPYIIVMKNNSIL
jgi:hypothetical protein